MELLVKSDSQESEILSDIKLYEIIPKMQARARLRENRETSEPSMAAPQTLAQNRWILHVSFLEFLIRLERFKYEITPGSGIAYITQEATPCGSWVLRF